MCNVKDTGLADPGGVVTATWTVINRPADATIVPAANKLDATARFSAVGEYVLQVIANNGLFDSVKPKTVPVLVANRVADGLITLFNFREGGGNLTTSTSGLALRIGQPASARLRPEGGLEMKAAAAVASDASVANPIVTAVTGVNAFRFELWIAPASDNVAPARIFSMEGAFGVGRNITLQQGTPDSPASITHYVMRTRTNPAADDSAPVKTDAGAVVAGSPQHVVFAREPNGRMSMFVNGVRRADVPVPGSLQDWTFNFPVVLGSSRDSSDPWKGVFHVVAAYNRALTEAEVKTNLSAGPDVRLVGGAAV